MTIGWKASDFEAGDLIQILPNGPRMYVIRADGDRVYVDVAGGPRSYYPQQIATRQRGGRRGEIAKRPTATH